MKRLVLAVVLSVGAGSAALAADLPPPMAPPPRAPATYVPAPVPFYNWSGFYIGGNVGAAFSSSSTFSDPVPPSVFNSTTSNQFLGGGQVGVNWEFGPGVVIGAEADFDWLPNTQNTLTATRPRWRYRHCDHQQPLADTSRRQAWLCVGSSYCLRQGRRRFRRCEQF